MIWTEQEDEEKEEIKHAEYVAQWEENNERILSRNGRSGRPKSATDDNGVSTHIVEGEQKKPFPGKEVDNG